MSWFIKCLKNYANFNGRARRKEFWFFALFFGIFFSVFWILAMIIGIGPAIAGDPTPLIVFSILAFLIVLAFCCPSIAVTVRRLHDIGKPGVYYFMSFIPFAGPIILLVYCATEGTPGENQWGPNPKEVPEV